jgi:Arc/MetJ-type ribon-helix-helix transcriptional regulator
MQLSLNPDIQRFIDEQVKTGRFPSHEAVIEAAISEWRDAGEAALDAQTISAINEAEEQADRGEGMDLDEFRAHIKRRMSGT